VRRPHRWSGLDDLYVNEVPFGGRDETAAHLEGQIAKKKKFRGVNRRFEA